jgi:predicted short-subunit dehydrogenase-like oxidoreductase (DUF2520 family)
MNLKDATLGIIGCGRVGRTLGQALARAGYRVRGAWSRSAKDLATFAGEVPGAAALASAQQVADTCDFVWLTVSDDAIEPVASALRWRPAHHVVHCSGATEIAALAQVGRDGGRFGGFHPLQMFANPAVALQGLPGCTVGIEAEGAFEDGLRQLARDLGCVPIRVPQGARAAYHASAYYVGPFLIALLAEAAALWKSFGAGDQQALEALLPLLAGTVAAARDSGLAQGMGGCVARGDVGTVEKHLRALDQLQPGVGALYRELALRTIPLGLARGTLSAPAAERIENAITEGPRAERIFL